MSDAVFSFLMGIVVGVGLACFVIAYRDAAPGYAPRAPFMDGHVYYSADGCWRQEGGFWHPLHRCHIVRIPAPEDPKE